MAKHYGRPSTGQKGNNRPTVVISRENYDEIDALSIGTGMTRSAISLRTITDSMVLKPRRSLFLC